MVKRVGMKNQPKQDSPDPQGWEKILDKNEQVLWRGRPDTGIEIKLTNIFLIIFGLAFAGFALLWMVLAYSTPGGFWMFGLIHFTAGVLLVLGAIFGGPYKRKRTWYSLTNKRAIIATNFPIVGKKLNSFPIDGSTPLELTPGPLGTIYFAHRTKRRKNRNEMVKIGFERIDDVDHVYRLIRDIQESDQ